MSTLKTVPNKLPVDDFLKSVSPEIRKKDGFRLLQIFEEETQEKSILWGPSIVGFGSYDYQYPNGKTMKWFPVGFSPRKASLSLYLMRSHAEMMEELQQLGKHKRGKGCLYINKLSDVDEAVLRKMIRDTYLTLTQ
ncbi:DUF1801 domain-containing protein [Algoriphagus namhaensis]